MNYQKNVMSCLVIGGESWQSLYWIIKRKEYFGYGDGTDRLKPS